MIPKKVFRKRGVRQDGTILPFLKKARRESDDLSWNSEEEDQVQEQVQEEKKDTGLLESREMEKTDSR